MDASNAHKLTPTNYATQKTRRADCSWGCAELRASRITSKHKSPAWSIEVEGRKTWKNYHRYDLKIGK